ncbi:hypothetical protein PIB30_009257 [Stylosanthes scabra]|uniref:Uncharacterized protein n=1 Tax=Stylosanthes scabra TaxID=79078 RepID=A0ABU6R430_9FABA|nr:hypothetical protein [Stylosanthes scabra]
MTHLRLAIMSWPPARKVKGPVELPTKFQRLLVLCCYRSINRCVSVCGRSKTKIERKIKQIKGIEKQAMEGLIPYIIDVVRDKKQKAKPKRSWSRSDSYRLLLGSDSFGRSEPHNHIVAVSTPKSNASNASQYHHHPSNNIRKRYAQS